MRQFLIYTGIYFLLFISISAHGQIPKVWLKGYFLKDSVKLGQSLKYVLVATHDPNAELVFPDTSFVFAPFELVHKDYYPTVTNGPVSKDSTVYTLQTFDLSAVQKLQMHAKLFLNGDTLELKTRPDSVFLIQQVAEVAEPLALQSVTDLRPIIEQFNYLYWGLGLVAIVILIGGIWAIFGKSIIIRYKLYVLQKDQAQFQNRFQNVKERFRRLKTMEPLERAITLWKNYLTKLEEEEISSFTTKEITTYYLEDERVSNSLKICDRAIYGNIISDDETEVANALAQLAEFAAVRYSIIQESLRHVADTR